MPPHTKKIPLKSAAGFSLPVLGLGTWGIGGYDSHDPLNNDKSQINNLREALRLGFTHLDTAEGYAEGYSEILTGKAIKDLNRQELFITTKVRRRNLHYDDLIKAAQESLKRLDTPWIDLYLIHASNPEIPLPETMRALDTLKENGLIKNIGVSNFNVPLLKEAMAYTKYRIVNNQIHFNLAVRDYEENMTLDFCQKNGIIVTAYRAIRHDQYDPEGLAILQNLAKKYQKTPAQITLNWLSQKPNIVTLVKSTNLEHLKENIDAFNFNLDSSDIKFLNEKFPRSKALNLPQNV